MEPPSSPPSEATNPEGALSWYKAQYEILESELAEFRESSRELEQELEKDIERAEKQERVLQEKAEALNFEVEEWKRKYKESKSEASAAQAALEKEITTLRDANRSLNLKLRDIEVANDDFERQARNTTSSLEDMESKFNQAIERAVIMEEEIKMGEQERENIRIESQRLREEMSELKIEAEVMQDKLKKFEASRHLSTISSDLSILESPTFDKNTDASPESNASSPLITTPPEVKSLGDITTEFLDPPPSPPMSDASAPLPRPSRIRTPAPGSATLRRTTRLPSVDASSTPRVRGVKAPPLNTRLPAGGRPSLGSNTNGGVSLRAPSRSSQSRPTSHKTAGSNSLSHIRLLTAQMQRLEARVQSVRSKLPAPSHTPPRVSPRSKGAATPTIPSTITVRSRKRGTTASTTSSMGGDEVTPTSSYASSSRNGHTSRLSTSGVSRLSFGPASGRGTEPEIRPSSRTSMSAYARPASRNDMVPPPRPMSRTSFSGVRTPMGRPPSSMSGSMHGHSSSLSQIDLEEEYEGEYRTPSRRGTYTMDFSKSVSGIPMPGSGIPTPTSRRQSGGRRTSTSGISHSGRQSTSGFRKLGDLGETY